MYVVKVMPVSRGVFKDHLSFFSKESIEPGIVVDVTIRNKKTPALVIESIDAREEKSQLRSESFALKKLVPKIKRRIFPTSTIEALKESAAYHAVHDGVIFSHFTPNAILSADQYVAEAKNDDEEVISIDRLALQATFDERMSSYRNITRESFARGQSVMILAPTTEEAENLYQELSRGIEEQAVLLTSALTKKVSVTLWNKVVEDPEPLLIILTHSFLTIPRNDLKTIIIERESARSYAGREKAQFDTRITAEAIARNQGARIVFADFPLRIETRARLESGDVDELSRLQVSVRSGASVRAVDAKTKKDDLAPKKKFSPFTDIVYSAIEKELKKGGRVFLYTSRRGIAPLTVCNDCGTPVTDPATGTPMTLHKTEEGNVFISFKSGAVIPSHSPCRSCGGWNLVSLGIGAERVYDEIKKLFPKTPTFFGTQESAPTHTKAKKLVNQFFSEPSSILIGTERILPYLREPVDVSVVVSLDSMLSSSQWRAHTYALHTLFYIRDKTSDTLFVQTRLTDHPVIKAISSGNPTDFIQQELRERKQFEYPPFATFVGLSWTGTERAVEKNSETIKTLLDEWDIVGPLPPRAIAKNRFVGKAVIRLEKNEWPDDALVEIIKNLPPDVSVAVDPDDIV